MTEEPIYINIAVEDPLSEEILRSTLRQGKKKFLVNSCYRRGGNSRIQKNMPAFNNASKILPHLVLTDLDDCPCPLTLLKRWLPQHKHPNLIFRIAVKEVEAWVMADRKAFTNYLGISDSLIPPDVDTIQNPKQFLINLAKRSRRRDLKDAIVPPPGSSAKVGKDYNGALGEFVRNNWNLQVAITHSHSLWRMAEALDAFNLTTPE